MGVGLGVGVGAGLGVGAGGDGEGLDPPTTWHSVMLLALQIVP